MATDTKKTPTENKKQTRPKNGLINGGNQDIAPEDLPVMIYDKWCKGCGICVAFCPKKVLEFDEVRQKPMVARPEDCIRCGLCELRCPDFAITRVEPPEDNGDDEEDNGRED